jgi:DNA-binding transcriptional LysR family regulator
MARASLNDLAVFAAVVDAGSFSAAASRLGLSKAAVSEQVRRLETRLGARLLNRTTRRLALTEAGAACHRHCQRMLSEADAAERAAIAHQEAPVGVLRVTAPETFTALHVAPAMPSFLAQHPSLSVELSASAELIDLIENRFDLAIRIGALPDSGLVARRLAMARLMIVAAPSYLKRRGAPRTVADLSAHDALSFLPHRWGSEWRISKGEGAVRRVPMNIRLTADSGDALLAATLAGLGLALLPNWLAQKHVASGALGRVLESWGGAPMPIQAVHASESLASAKVRLFTDHLVQHFKGAAF